MIIMQSASHDMRPLSKSTASFSNRPLPSPSTSSIRWRMADRGKEVAETARLARWGAALGPDDAVALSRSAHALAFVVGDLDAATAFVDRALVLNPNLSLAERLGEDLSRRTGGGNRAVRAGNAPQSP